MLFIDTSVNLGRVGAMRKETTERAPEFRNLQSIGLVKREVDHQQLLTVEIPVVRALTLAL